MECNKCKKIFKENEPSWYDEQTQKHTCDNLIRWSVDVGIVRFAEDSYGITGTPYERFDDYIKGKYRLMHDNFIMWVASLDDQNRERLARSINNNKTNEGE